MVDGKTGGLFSFALRMMLLASKQHIDADDTEMPGSTSEILFSLTRLLGRFFQVRDDYLNLTASEYAEKKGIMEDLDEGKFSFPLILAIQSSAENRDYILGLLKWAERPLARKTKEFLLGLMRRSGALARAKAKIRSLQDEREIQILDMEKIFGRENPVLRELVEKLKI
jgi:geranylgeranyl pyrophosphate synthase